MRLASAIGAACAVAMCNCAPPRDSTSRTADAFKATPLILEKNEGEQRTWRGWPAHPNAGSTFYLKVDPKNGGSSQLVFGTEELAPGDSIETHRHPSADEILVLETGTARVHVGALVRDVHGGSSVFIPADTWVSVSNLGRDPIDVEFIFSAPGFEDFMRAGSARAGEKNVPLSQAEEDSLEKTHARAVIYR
jgi:quercetin dioxygenase-like cupin family protein